MINHAWMNLTDAVLEEKCEELKKQTEELIKKEREAEAQAKLEELLNRPLNEEKKDNRGTGS